MELRWDRGTKVCSNSPGHMTKMAVMLIYGKNLEKNLLLLNQKADNLETLYAASGARVLTSSNDDPEIPLTYFTAMSNLIPYVCVWEKCKRQDFSEIIVVLDIKVGRYSFK